MSTLTQNEREGLDDVFRSIHTHNNSYLKFKKISTVFTSTQDRLNIKNLIIEAKIGLKETRLPSFFSTFSKKKKNLSK